ncbi:hybrid sensor histidine kinase/response regulator transcription factor [Dyadobacter aurulentus]|uniref:hybrid sensor histidine kinase/response regulator transcription factor n=1 Tax=Dyadobacter sp. UC 10 TaxID=2605428 RepID=UPI0011F3AF90|nr:two-component regulator propeller domain-containing protein [Dyadobacter sp. UC 10]KAA0992203.1 response regulator [Dyadobacter sp. UC 10]
MRSWLWHFCWIVTLVSGRLEKGLAQSNEYQFARYNTERGLSHNQINCFLKDSQGFVWIGTANGLNRFDGYSFRVFKHIPGDSATISDRRVNAIFEDPQGFIWINTQIGFDIYDPVTERIEHNADQAAKRLGLPDANFSRIIRTRSGDYWINHNRLGLLKFLTRSKKLVKVKFGPSEDSFAPAKRVISDFDEDVQGNLWVVCDDGFLARVNARTQLIDVQSALLQSRNLGNLSNHRVFVDDDGEPWVYIVKAALGAFCFDFKNNTLRVANTAEPDFRLNNNTVSAMVAGPDGRIWLGTDHGGINVIDKKSGNVSTLLFNPGDPRTISQNSVQALYKDPTGMIWAGTFKKGFCSYHKNIFKFSLIQHAPGDPGSLPFDDVNMFVEDRKGNLWLGMNGGGLVYFDRKNNSFRQYRNIPGDPQSLSNNVIVSLFLDKSDVLWIGTYFGGLNSFDGKKFTRYLHDPSDSTSLIDDRVWEIFEDSQKRLWVGTLADGLDLFDRNKKTFRHYQRAAPNSVSSDYISAMLEDRQGNLWIGTANGVDVLMRQTGRFVHYANKPGDGTSLSSDGVTSLAQDAFDNIWIGTSEGLNRYDARTNAFVAYDTRHGLPDNSVLTVAVDGMQNLWLGTPKGLVNINIYKRTGGIPAALQVRTFNEVDGLQGRGFNENAALRLRSGEMVFGGANGFSIFDPKQIIDEQVAARVTLTDFQIFNKSVQPGELLSGKAVLEKSVSQTDQITLKHSQNVFTIEFAALNYLHPEKNHYLYTLEGFNGQWFEADNTRKVTYTNLDPGTYVFRVKMKEGGASTERSLRVVILPPFWRTPWAYLLYFLLVAGALMIARWILIERARMNFKLEQERHYAQQMHELDMMKIRFFTNVSHEFRTPLTLMLTPLENLLKNIRSDHAVHRQLSLVHRNAQRLFNLVTQMLDFKKLEVEETQFRPERGDIVRFLSQIAQTFSDLSEHKHIQYRFESEVTSRYADFDQDKLSKVMYNLLSNAFKFTPENGEVTVSLRVVKRESGENLEISVADSGIGIPEEAQARVFERFYQHPMPDHIVNQGSGIGLSIAGEFVRMHGGTIDLKSAVGEGSTFTVTLPLQESPPAITSTPEPAASPAEASAIEIELPTDRPTKNKPLLLLVEDNDEFRAYLKEVFQRSYDILEAPNGKAGLDATLEHIPDLIVSDVMMPEMDGIELCRIIKTDRRISHIPVVLLTARAEEEQQLQGYQTGADAYVTKPFRLDILEVRIANLIRQREQLQQQFQQHVKIRPSEVAVRSLDEQFVNSAVKVVEANLANPEFTVEELSDAMSMSRVYLYKKILSLTGKTPIEFIRIIRIRRGAGLLEKSQLTVSEIAYQIGFNNPKYFAKLFKEEYQMLPTEYRRQQVTQE